MEIAVPRWREEPGTLRQGTSVVRPEATGESITTDSTGTDSGGGLGRTLARLALYPGSLLERLRENPKNEWLKSYAYLRDLLLDVGRRATLSGHLGAPDDVFYLSFDTARRLLSEPPSRHYTRRRVARAKQEYERNECYSPPLFVDRDFRPIERGPQREEGGLSGLGVSEGGVSGRAIVARSPEAVDLSERSAAGERAILVTEFTDAGWTPLFFQVDGLVMERGSLLSHGSIVAREAGIPAVVNVDGAMEQIDTGDRMAVDAETGSIEILDR
jgi:pyruvate,water dikinase